MSFEEIVNGQDRCTYNGWRTKCDHKSSPCHYMAGELKMLQQKPLFCATQNHQIKYAKTKIMLQQKMLLYTCKYIHLHINYQGDHLCALYSCELSKFLSLKILSIKLNIQNSYTHAHL